MNTFIYECIHMPLPPGLNTPWPLQLLEYVYRPTHFLDRCAARYGDIFTVRLGRIGTLVVVHAPEDVHRVFKADADVLRAGQSNEIARPIVGERSIFVMDGAAHLRKRRLLTPPFRGERMRAFAGAILETTHRAIDRWRPGQRFPIHRDMYAITLDVILRVVFGLEDEVAIAPLRRAFLALFAPTPAIFSFLPQAQIVFPGSPFWFWLRRRARVVALLDQLIASRRRTPNLEPRSDILSSLLLARDEDGVGLSDEEIHDELITAVVAGHETTATALSWAFERILVHPSVEARLRGELDGLADDALDHSPFLDCVISEVLRQRPPFPLAARAVCAPWSLGAWELPAGVIVAPSFYLTHKRPDLFEHPERFEPERWSGVKPDPFLYYPFGGGIRRCIGMAFALLEMKLIVATVFRRARLRLESGRALETVRRTITLFPRGGARVVIEDVH